MARFIKCPECGLSSSWSDFSAGNPQGKKITTQCFNCGATFSPNDSAQPRPTVQGTPSATQQKPLFVTFRCEFHHLIKAPSHMAGKTIRCPHKGCRVEVLVPGSAPAKSQEKDATLPQSPKEEVEPYGVAPPIDSREMQEVIDWYFGKRDAPQQTYMEVPRNLQSDGNALCSDDSCPCGVPGARIAPGEGYIYVSKEVADFRKDCPTAAQAQIKVQRIQQQLGAMIFAASGVFSPILMCELGARKRGLDMEVAASDARHWWKTGQVPIRPTPLEKQSGRGSFRSR